ncbi:MAG TPA: hypothetical protein VKZ53_19230 [Candidatus Angelobacter sp.]|nr:hypothetical protein [Candidatus Angelobacter sp.]
MNLACIRQKAHSVKSDRESPSASQVCWGAYIMTNQRALDVDWYQLIVTDGNGLKGSSVADFVAPLIHRLGASAVGMSDLEGAIPELKDYEDRVISPAAFLTKAASATQFDWAFIFLYVKNPSGELTDVDDKEAMLQADLTIRLADDTYFYVYGRDHNVMNDLRQRYPEAEFKVSKFFGLDIPY